jgi:hypothetical protein
MSFRDPEIQNANLHSPAQAPHALVIIVTGNSGCQAAWNRPAIFELEKVQRVSFDVQEDDDVFYLVYRLLQLVA